MEIRDVIHGSVFVDASELSIIDSRYFQRLRQIKQMGFADHSFPSATHSRFAHSLGTLKIADQAFETIFTQKQLPHLERISPSDYTRFRSVLRLAALLHDLGHGPFSHTTEFAMPEVNKLFAPILSSTPESLKAKKQKATHEDYTLRMILGSGLTHLITEIGKTAGFKPIHVAGLIDPKMEIPDDFFILTLSDPNNRIDFRPILTQIISSEIDADRMDYLRRDSFYSGVSYGQFDFDWLIGSLTSHIDHGKCYLALQHRALYTFEDFLISRFHMFLMVYFHHKSVVFDKMLEQFLNSPDCDYSLPTDIEKFCEMDDAHLRAHLAKSRNPWARRIIEQRPYRVFAEFHSGIPATKNAQSDQRSLFSQIESELQAKGIPYLTSTSTSELSKYFRRPGHPIFVQYDNHYSSPSHIVLEQCTDLFQKYEEKRSITRLYVSPEDYLQLARPR